MARHPDGCRLCCLALIEPREDAQQAGSRLGSGLQRHSMSVWVWESPTLPCSLVWRFSVFCKKRKGSASYFFHYCLLRVTRD